MFIDLRSEASAAARKQKHFPDVASRLVTCREDASHAQQDAQRFDKALTQVSEVHATLRISPAHSRTAALLNGTGF